ncbi:MAG: DNA alkylation repair protein [Bacteroidia bacterium]
MAEPLKNMFSPALMKRLALDLNRVCDIPTKDFVDLVMDADWEKRELKQRSRHIAACLNRLISGTYAEQIEALRKMSKGYSGYTAILFSDFIEAYGLKNWKVSIKAMEEFTQLCTAEFAVRPYFMMDFDKMVKQHQSWSTHKNEHVRRLASEGIRPRLPWGMGVPRLKKEPEVIFPILDKLVDDPSEYVRRSVANNLNDISKDHPEKVLDYVSQLDLNDINTQKLAKHALRGLLKKGNKTALRLFGFHDHLEVNCLNLNVSQNELSIGDLLLWSFDLDVKGEGKLRLEYHLYFQKASGKQVHKVFQLSEQTIKAATQIRMSRKHAFRDLTTRKHYPGVQRLELVANGRVVAGIDFELLS